MANSAETSLRVTRERVIAAKHALESKRRDGESWEECHRRSVDDAYLALKCRCTGNLGDVESDGNRVMWCQLCGGFIFDPVTDGVV